LNTTAQQKNKEQMLQECTRANVIGILGCFLLLSAMSTNQQAKTDKTITTAAATAWQIRHPSSIIRRPLENKNTKTSS
jgi:hypothetical protein